MPRRRKHCNTSTNTRRNFQGSTTCHYSAGVKFLVILDTESGEQLEIVDFDPCRLIIGNQTPPEF